MKKIVFLVMMSLVLMANSDCEGGSFEQDIQTYLVVDKGDHVSSHFNIFHKDGFAVETDYFVTFKNVSTGHTFVHKFNRGEDYYSYEKGKKYRCKRFYEDNKYKRK